MSVVVEFQCIRCRHEEYEIGQIHAAGGFGSKVIDVEDRRVFIFTLARCKHTKFFKTDRNSLANAFD